MFNFKQLWKIKRIQYKNILDLGYPYRIWPYSDGKELIFTIANGRTGRKKRCEVFLKYSNKFELLKDVYLENQLATSTGQPFITSKGYYLVPVWNVDYYLKGKSYGAIYLSKDNGRGWEKVYENCDATYINHFYEDELGVIYIGCGFRGGGRNNKICFTPESGFVLRSADNGIHWEKYLDYNKPGALYSVVKFRNNLIVSTREQKTVLIIDSDSNIHEKNIGCPTRNMRVIDGMLIISSDSSFIYTNDLINWSTHSFGKEAVLRYPTNVNGKLIFTALAKYPKSYLFGTDFKKNYYFDFSHCCRGYFSRLSLHDSCIYMGTEFNGKFISISIKDINFIVK